MKKKGGGGGGELPLSFLMMMIQIERKKMEEMFAKKEITPSEIHLQLWIQRLEGI